jgi:hypothetical protein
MLDDHLALLVGRVILAWGLFDQQFHATIRSLEQALDEPQTSEGRFNERRKLFRRYCIRLIQNDKITADLDRFLGRLQKLERFRGRLAHGWVNEVDGGVECYDFAEATDDKKDVQPREWFIPLDQLRSLPDDIENARGEVIRFQFVAIERRELLAGRPSFPQWRTRQTQDRQSPPDPSKPSDTEKGAS